MKETIEQSESRAEKIIQADHENNIHYCPNCKCKRPIELTFFNPDTDTKPELIACLVCDEEIGHIDHL